MEDALRISAGRPCFYDSVEDANVLCNPFDSKVGPCWGTGACNRKKLHFIGRQAFFRCFGPQCNAAIQVFNVWHDMICFQQLLVLLLQLITDEYRACGDDPLCQRLADMLKHHFQYSQPIGTVHTNNQIEHFSQLRAAV